LQDFSKNIEIRLLPSGSAEKTSWDEFDRTSAHPANTTCYAHIYRKRLASPLFLEARIEKEKVSQWLLCKRRILRKLLQCYLFSQCGPQVTYSHASYYDEIFSSYIQFLRHSFNPMNILVLNHALVRGITRSALEKSAFQNITECVPYISRLDASDEAILNSFHVSHRNDTRKAIKESFRYDPNIQICQYFPLSAATYGRSGLEGHPKDYLEDLESHLVSDGKGFISGVYVGDKLVTASIIIHHGDNAFYLHGASVSPKPRGATTFLQFKNMLRLRDLGVKCYDMGGAKLVENTDSKTVTLTRFKSRFGGTPSSAFEGSLFPLQKGMAGVS
jgi:GNAT acetyltransferase-like protein